MKLKSIVLLSVVLPAAYGCSAFFGGSGMRTEIIAAPFGMTQHVKEFKMGTVKPAGHVIWGDDIRDGSDCSIVITSISLGKPVFTYHFTYTRETARPGYNFPGGKIMEPDPFWYKKVGRYIVTLYDGDRRIGSDTFNIVP